MDNVDDSSDLINVVKPTFTCKYCGAPSFVDPIDQVAPVDYCHDIDHHGEN
jgi:hypothetical protein